MLSYDLPIMLFALGGNIFLSLFTFLKNPKSATNRLFFAFTISLSLYLVVNFLASHQTTSQMTLIWVRTIMSIAVVINLLFYLLVTTFPQQKLQVNRKILFAAIALTLLMLPLTQTSLIYKEVIIKANNVESIPGIGMPLFLLHTLIFIGGGLFALIRKLLRANGLEKTQIRFFFLGAVFMFLSILVTNLLFVLIFNTSAFIGFLPIYILFFVGFISYAIVRHRFLDIRLVVARTVSFALLTTIFALVYALAFAIPTFLLATTITKLQTVIISTILAALMAFTFQPLRRILEKVTDKIFFKDRYDDSKLLYDLALIMASTLRLEDLAHKLLSTLLQQIKISRGMLALMEKGRVYAVFHEGYSSYSYSLNLSEKEIEELIHQNKTLISEELAEGNIKEMLRKLDSTLVIPLKLGETYAGLLIMGEKLSGDIYTPEDIRVLETLAPEAAVAIQNTKSYEEIRKFNITLQEEVAKATADLQHANTRLKELDKLKDDFVSVASHELRTPMTAIRSYAWMALNRPDVPLTEKMKKYLSRTLISTERLINLVNDMLNVSRIEAGRIEIRPTPFEIPTLVDDVLSEVGPKASEKMIHLQNQKIQLPKVFADPDKVHQILLNLIGNALKFTPTDGTISVSFFTDGQVVDISVKDSGVGISKDDMPRLFQKFGRLDNSYVAAATSGGTGLGLFICKNLVELMGGKIWVYSEGMGKGTAFTFSLPIASLAILAQAEKFTRKAVGGDIKELEPVAI